MKGGPARAPRSLGRDTDRGELEQNPRLVPASRDQLLAIVGEHLGELDDDKLATMTRLLAAADRGRRRFGGVFGDETDSDLVDQALALLLEFLSRARQPQSDVRCNHGCIVEPSTWVVEWSPNQRAIHIDQLDSIIDTNRAIATRQPFTAPSGYIVVGVFPSFEAAHEFADVVEPKLRAAWMAPIGASGGAQ